MRVPEENLSRLFLRVQASSLPHPLLPYWSTRSLTTNQSSGRELVPALPGGAGFQPARFLHTCVRDQKSVNLPPVHGSRDLFAFNQASKVLVFFPSVT